MIEKWDKLTLVERIEQLQEELIRSSSGAIKPKLVVSKNSTPLFEYNSDTKEILITATNDAKRDVEVSLDRVGALTVNIQFLPPAELDLSVVLIRTNDQDWPEIFARILRSLGDEVYLIPDTNFVCKHYASNVLLLSLKWDAFLKLKFRLSRLLLLEIERMFNQAKMESKERRLALYAAREVLFLKDCNADFLPQVEVSLLEGFSRIAGSGFADAWIRREIYGFIRKEILGKSEIAQKKIGVVFLTCDLMNALCAGAENIPTFLFSTIKDERIVLKNHSQLAELIIDTAIAIERLEISIPFSDKETKFLVRGIWPSKTVLDWKDDCIMVDIPNNT